MDRRAFVGAALIGGAIAGAVGAEAVRVAQSGAAPAAVPDYFTPPPRDPALPTLLLIGDSISVSYTLPVRTILTGLFNVERPPENCRHSSYILEHLDSWLGDRRYDMIHFNSGLHDLARVQREGIALEQSKLTETGERWISLSSYQQNLNAIVARLKATAAAVSFATTTPVPPGVTGRRTEDVAAYNEAAMEIMRRNNVPVNDLYTAVLPFLKGLQFPDDVHFTAEGQAFLGAAVSRFVQASPDI